MHEGLRRAEQAPRPRRRDQRLLRSEGLRAGHQHAPLQQVRAVRAPGLRPARGRRRSCTATSRSSTARPATRARSRSRSRCSRPTRREHEKYCKELEAYCTKYAMPFFRTHTSIPFDELVLEDLPLGRLSAVTLPRAASGCRPLGVRRARRGRARGRRVHHQDAAAPLRGAVLAAVAARARAEGRQRAVEAAQAADLAAAHPR